MHEDMRMLARGRVFRFEPRVLSLFLSLVSYLSYPLLLLPDGATGVHTVHRAILC
jgi:hypothetical protein